MALMGYVNSYGVPLTLSALAIGITLALQFDRWRENPSSIIDDLKG